MPEYVRVKDKQTGHEFSMPAGTFDEDAVTVLKKDAVDAGGEPLPTKHKTTADQAASNK
ncbi:hypothetical protein [uncultured Arthrobacter sp.]|uniref:hypothetical protein n=1 Tax=uncultured Arthrobacter sp. TaxID=114050 RepID=UPI0025F3B65D|nr:hypothetical protein [uncultured Arthrobacter sp.]